MKNALIVIDVQKDYQSGGALEIRGFDKAAKNISMLLDWARSGKADVFHVQHISEDMEDESFKPDSFGIEFADGFTPLQNERAFKKSKPSSFSSPSFTDSLAEGNYDQILICGFSSFLCCDSTCRDAYHKGYNVIFMEDAIGEFAIDGFTEEQLHAYACAVQGIEFATIQQTRNITG